MAFLQNLHCPYCKQETPHYNGRCSICEERLERERIAQWNAQTLDEKLNNIRERLENLERKPRVYG